MESKFLDFVEVEKPGRKTKVYQVWSKVTHRELLGGIQYCVPWRCFVFVPCEDTFYDIGCLEDIVKFIREITEEWKAGLKK